MILPEQLHEVVVRFENEWRQHIRPPEIASAISSANFQDLPRSSRIQLIVELIAVDLEFRWKFNSQKSAKPIIQRFVIEDYLQTFPNEFQESWQLLELICEEYRVRQLWGDRPSQDIYRSRFPNHSEQLKDLLDEIEEELAVETESNFELRVSHSSAPLPSNSAGSVNNAAAPLRYADYVLQEMLGSGGVGKVYRAVHKRTMKKVSVKY